MRAITERLRSLPQTVFIDPELASNPLRRVHEMLRKMARLGILLHSQKHYMLSENRRHPHFPEVADIVAFQAVFFAETLQGMQRTREERFAPVATA